MCDFVEKNSISNEETCIQDASELLEQLDEMCRRYNIDSDVINKFKSATTHWCVTRRERV